MHVDKDTGEPVYVVFLDTEGLKAPNSTDDHDAQIFALATLLSSLLIYNK